jgi:hypothetical protein
MTAYDAGSLLMRNGMAQSEIPDKRIQYPHTCTSGGYQKKGIEKELPDSGTEVKLILQEVEEQKQTQHQTCTVQNSPYDFIEVKLSDKLIQLKNKLIIICICKTHIFSSAILTVC